MKKVISVQVKEGVYNGRNYKNVTVGTVENATTRQYVDRYEAKVEFRGSQYNSYTFKYELLDFDAFLLLGKNINVDFDKVGNNYYIKKVSIDE